VYRVDTEWVGLDRMWGSLCVCCVSFRVEGVLKGSVGGGWAGVFMKIRPIKMETSEKSPTWKAAWVVQRWVSWSKHCTEDVAPDDGHIGARNMLRQ
jgi:hypothetical protein